MTDLRIADTPDLLTAEWFTSALSPALEGRKVTRVALAAVGTGQMCDSLRASLTFDGPTAVPSTLIAKLPAADETSRATARSMGSYENEVRFYQQLAGDLPMRTPEVWYADIDVETASFVLLLEDLANSRAGDQLAGCSVEQAQVAVDELVKLHAPRWGDAGLAEYPWLHRDPEMGQQLMMNLIPMMWDGFQRRYDAELTAEVREAGSQLVDHLAGYVLAETSPWTVVHGDYRLDNLLFPPPDRPDLDVVAVDWQTLSRGLPARDLAYLLGTGLESDLRAAHERDLVEAYRLALGTHGVDLDAVTQRQAWDDYRLAMLQGPLVTVFGCAYGTRTERGDAMFAAMARRSARAIRELGTLELAAALA